MEDEWQRFERWLADRLRALPEDEPLVLDAGPAGLVQFAGGGAAVHQETSAPPDADRAALLAALGWSAPDVAGHLPLPHAVWGAPPPRRSWWRGGGAEPTSLAPDEARAAAALSVRTLREALGVQRPHHLTIGP
ncbi:hypothetical protein F1C76_06545 [Geodermatophilaceae bacterium NBWT11]|nr:hypothetical protein F1C76_06545 [Geodermatophilaceae bacterium NBWT11]